MVETRFEWDEENVSYISDSLLIIKGPISRNESDLIMCSNGCILEDFGLTNFTK